MLNPEHCSLDGDYKDVYRVVIHTEQGPETIAIRGDTFEDCLREVDDGPNCPPTRYSYHRRVEIVRYTPVEVVRTVPNLSNTFRKDETLQGD